MVYHDPTTGKREPTMEDGLIQTILNLVSELVNAILAAVTGFLSGLGIPIDLGMIDL